MTSPSTDVAVASPQVVVPNGAQGVEVPWSIDNIPNYPDAELDLPQLARTYFYWTNGDPKMRKSGDISYTGGWASDAGKLDASLVDPSLFNIAVLASRDGTEFEVFSAPTIQVAIIGYRTAWRDDMEPPNYFREFAAGLRHYVEIACLVKGINKPAILSAKGYNGQNLLAAYSKGVNTIRGVLKAQKPPFAFWVPIGGEVDEAGKPKFTTVGKGEQTNTIVKIVNRFPAKVDRAWVDAAFVSQEVFAECVSFLPSLPEWKEARFAPRISVVDNDPPPPDDPPADDIPFE